ncbi:MAG: hypothetical protein ACK445_02565 [Bacteroidota bacterium]|jgi:hypothetical protein
MKRAAAFMFFLSIMLADTKAFSIQDARKAYDEVVYKAAAGKTFLVQAEKVKPSDPLLMGYVGAVKMIMAKHYINPWSKLNSFNQGKELLEKALTLQPEVIELVFLRFSIQSNSPTFLQYNQHLSKDKTFLLNNVASLKDKTLKDKIINYLLTSEALSPAEKQKLQA